MRVMVMIKGTEATEGGKMPSEAALTEMGDYNEELVKAGIMLDGAGLHPSAKGVRVQFSAAAPKTVDGPFAETKELLAGFWIWEVKSMEEAVEWAKRIPNPDGEHSEVELRPIFEPEDFGDAYTDEVRAQEDRIRAELEDKQAG